MCSLGILRSPTQGTAAREEDAIVADSGKQRGGCLAGASMSSVIEILGDKLSLLSPDGQPLSTPQHQRSPTQGATAHDESANTLPALVYTFSRLSRSTDRLWSPGECFDTLIWCAGVPGASHYVTGKRTGDGNSSENQEAYNSDV
ncbi:TPA: hypothetical protein ACH3X2_013535 [Trebouxia sp. C0005]